MVVSDKLHSGFAFWILIFPGHSDFGVSILNTFTAVPTYLAIEASWDSKLFSYVSAKTWNLVLKFIAELRIYFQISEFGYGVQFK